MPRWVGGVPCDDGQGLRGVLSSMEARVAAILIWERVPFLLRSAIWVRSVYELLWESAVFWERALSSWDWIRPTCGLSRGVVSLIWSSWTLAAIALEEGIDEEVEVVAIVSDGGGHDCEAGCEGPRDP